MALFAVATTMEATQKAICLILDNINYAPIAVSPIKICTIHDIGAKHALKW